MLAALVIAEDGGKQKEERAIKELAIIVGAAWPTCAAAKLETLQPSDVVRSLHVVGERDVINPPAQARRVAEAFGANAQVFEHERGHIVPMTDDAVATYVKFIEHL
jgi:pimeloyl-ACP methyl ester carboxylesterase